MKKSASIFLSLVIFIMGLQPGLAFHFCGGELSQVKVIAGYGIADCGMPHEHQKAETHPPCSVEKGACCQDIIRQGHVDAFVVFPYDAQKISLNAFAFTLPGKAFPLTTTSSFSALDTGFLPPPGIADVDLSAIGVFLL